MNARPRPAWPASLFVGALAAAGLVALYLGLISLAQGPDHAVYQLRTDLPLSEPSLSASASRSGSSRNSERLTRDLVGRV